MYDDRGPNDVGLSDGGLSNDGRLYHDGQIYNNRDSNHDNRPDNNNESIVDVGSNVEDWMTMKDQPTALFPLTTMEERLSDNTLMEDRLTEGTTVKD